MICCLVGLAVLGKPASKTGITLRSRVRGRERWEVPAILDDSRRAVSIKAILETEPGILRVEANETTGRVLVEYSPSQIRESVEILIIRASNHGNMLPEECKRVSPVQRSMSPFGAFVVAELAHTLLELLGFTTVGAAAVTVIGFLALARAWNTTERITNGTAPARRIKVDQSGGVRDDQDRAQVVQYRRDDWIDRSRRGQV